MAEALTHNVNESLINGYLSDLDEILADLESAKTSLGTDFVQEGSNYFPEVGNYIKYAYGIEEKENLIEALKTAIGKYKAWIEKTMQECFNEDDEKANTTGKDEIGNEQEPGQSTPGDADDDDSTVKNPENKTVDTEKLTTPKSTTQITSPELTNTGGNNGGNGTGTTNIPSGSQTSEGSSSSGSAGTDNTSGGLKTGSNSSGTSTLNPFGIDNNYGTNGHSVGGSLANSVMGDSTTSNKDASSSGKGLGKGLLNNLSELTSGVSLGDMMGNGMGSASVFSVKSGNYGNNNLGTIAKAGLALGLAGAGAAIATAVHEKFYVFDQEDWESLVPTDADNILQKFNEVKMSDGQVELFETSTFKIKADILDKPAKQLEGLVKDVPDIRQELLNKYRFDIFSEKGKVDRYLLFILMIIDGQSSISEYNYITIISDFAEEIDTSYCGLQMEDFLYEFEEEQTQTEEQEAY